MKTFNHPRGFSFQYPDGWQIENNNELTQLVPPGSSSDDQSESYRILVQELPIQADDARFEQELDNMLIQLNPTLRRSSKGQPFKTDKMPNAFFIWEGVNQLDGSRMLVQVFAVSFKNHTVMLFAGGHKQRIEARQGILREIASTIAVGRDSLGNEIAIKGPPEDRSPLAQQWIKHIGGKKLTMMSRYDGAAGGYTTKIEFYLLKDGRFHFNLNDSGAVSVPGAGGYFGDRKSGAGRWRIYTQNAEAFLELRYDNGQTEVSILKYEDNKTYINGRRVYVTEMDQ